MDFKHKFMICLKKIAKVKSKSIDLKTSLKKQRTVFLQKLI